MNLFGSLKRKSKASTGRDCLRNARVKTKGNNGLQPEEAIRRMLSISTEDVRSGRHKIQLYRFLTDNLPVISSCIWTWVRLSAAGGQFRIKRFNDSRESAGAEEHLNGLADRIYGTSGGNRSGLVGFMTDLFNSIFRDGMCGGFLTIKPDASGVDQFILIDPMNIECQSQGGRQQLYLDTGDAKIPLDRPDFYYIPANGSVSNPLGRSILQAVPFVSYIEQQLVNDMRRASHNSGYHRLHVKLTPPDRSAGESDTAYVDRINQYFDSTVDMIKACDIDENPVTWDNVSIDYIGPSAARGITNSWFMQHRAMVEEICAGTNLAPFLLGYSYGATTTWSSFKFDLVMRQVKTFQAEVGHFLEWIGNIELALIGYDMTCRFEFDNTFPYQSTEKAAVESQKIEDLLKLHQAGLIDSKVIKEKIRDLL